MDTNSGRFVPNDPAVNPHTTKVWKQISVGELVTVKGEVCEVLRFTERTVELKLLSKAERLGRQTDADIAALARAESLREEVSE